MILLRHGQSEFNLHFTRLKRDPGIVDPVLTPLGHEQARAAGQALRGQGVRRIIASPYRRTLQTADAVAAVLGVKVEIHPIVRERYGYTCDIGSPVSVLRADWPHHDFSDMEEVWWPGEEEPVDSILGRAATFRTALAAREDWRETLVVSHWGFILSLTGQSVANGTWLRCDATAEPPAEIVWRHH
jgi:broad specificity phosphatase PhoE